MRVVLGLRAAFAFPLSDTLTFGVFQRFQHCTFVESCFVAFFAFLVLVVEFSQDSVSIWDFLVLGWLALAIVVFAITISLVSHDLRWCIAGCDRVSEPYKAVIVTVFFPW